MVETLCIVVPVFNDWPSLSILLKRLNEVAETLPVRLFVTVVNDGSSELVGSHLDVVASCTALAGVEIVHLALNMGHQRAIAIGMCTAVADHDLDAVLVMDGDGEDPPESIGALLQAAAKSPDFCVVAQRRKRTEKLTFKLSYIVYKGLFRLITGKEINFGNFSISSRRYAARLVMVADLWNNLPAAILRSRLPVQRLPVDRGHRYAGKSKMNFVSLIVHGMSGISVYAETIFVRLILLTIALFGLTAVSVTFVVFLRIFYPQYATPGWATTVSFGMIIILTQVLFTALSSILMVLNNRVQRLVVPLKEFRDYVGSVELLVGACPARDEAKPSLPG